MKLIQRIKSELGLLDYGTKCHGYDSDGSHAHFYRCNDDDCPNKLPKGVYFDKEEMKWSDKI